MEGRGADLLPCAALEEDAASAKRRSARASAAEKISRYFPKVMGGVSGGGL